MWVQRPFGVRSNWQHAISGCADLVDRHPVVKTRRRAL
jgi:hypothetical protein